MISRIRFIFLLFFPLTLFAQTVSNIRAQQEGREIAVYYDLSALANIQLQVTIDGKQVPVKLLSGDVGKRIEAGERKRIAWRVLDEKDGRFKARNVVFSVKALAPWRTFILAEGAASPMPFQPSAGLMVGAVSRVGFYAKARTGFQYGNYRGTLSFHYDDIYIYQAHIGEEKIYLRDADMPYYLTNNRKQTFWVADAGAIVRAYYKEDIMLYVYAGAGYGKRQLLLQNYRNEWLKYTPTSFSGLSAELGLMMAYKHFALSAGVNTISFKYLDVQLGLGYIF